MEQKYSRFYYSHRKNVKITLLNNLGRDCCTNISIHILRFRNQLIKIDRPDQNFTGINGLFHLKMSPLPGYHERLMGTL